MLKTVKLIVELKKMQKLYDEVYPLIDGLPFKGSHAPDEAPLHYFSQAASLCNLAESLIDKLIDHVKERNIAFMNLLLKINEWENRIESPAPEETELIERINEALAKRKVSEKQIITKMLKKAK